MSSFAIIFYDSISVRFLTSAMYTFVLVFVLLLLKFMSEKKREKKHLWNILKSIFQWFMCLRAYSTFYNQTMIKKLGEKVALKWNCCMCACKLRCNNFFIKALVGKKSFLEREREREHDEGEDSNNNSSIQQMYTKNAIAYTHFNIIYNYWENELENTLLYELINDRIMWYTFL